MNNMQLGVNIKSNRLANLKRTYSGEHLERELVDFVADYGPIGTPYLIIDDDDLDNDTVTDEN